MRNKKVNLLNKIEEELSAELKSLILSRTYRVYIEHEDHFSDDYETTMNLGEIADYDGNILWTQLHVSEDTNNNMNRAVYEGGYNDKRMYQADFIKRHKKDIMFFKKISKAIKKDIERINKMISFYKNLEIYDIEPPVLAD